MSVIHEALKKAQEDLQQQNFQENPTLSEAKEQPREQPKIVNLIEDIMQELQPKASQENTSKEDTSKGLAINDVQQKIQSEPMSPIAPSPRIKNAVLFPITILLISLGIIASGLLTISVTSSNRQPPQAAKQKTQTESLEKSIPLASSKPSPIKSSPAILNTLTLNGIIATDAGQMVLINNEILKEGDVINGKKILNIYPDKVELFAHGEIITLRTN